MNGRTEPAAGEAVVAKDARPAKASRKAKPAEAKPAGAQPAAAKSIILFSDGTGNSSGKLFKTNVWRMYEAVDLGPAFAGRHRQIAYYDDGVGTSAFRPLRMLQGVFGIGLRRNVLEIYRYACRNYDPDSVPPADGPIAEKGDHIYGFGFSRGAFTMRLVIGLIADQGLVPYINDQDLERESKAAWKRFRRKWPRSIERVLGWLGKEDDDQPSDPDSETGAPSRNHRPVIRFIGVWDTVAAYGGPIVEITRAIDNFLYRLSMPNYELSPRVRCARHALALDDERDSFQPLLWDELAEKQLWGRNVDGRPAPWLAEGRLQQVWFTGMHADVGGGYPDESLSYVSLLWMLEEAHQHGLRTVDEVTDRYHGLANSLGPIHNSRAGLASYYRYQPRRIDGWLEPVDKRTLSLRDPAIRHQSGPLEGKQKGLVERGKIRVHASVITRIAGGTDGYAPIVLPEEFEIVPAGALAETKFLPSTRATPPPAPGTPAPPLVTPQVLGWLNAAGVKQNVAAAMERAWDLVWQRRANYFATVLATIALLTMPFGWVERLSSRPFVAWLLDQLPQYNWIRSLGEGLGNLLLAPGAMLPDFLGSWLQAWAARPFWFLAVLTIVLLLMRRGTSLEARIRDFSRSVWHGAIPRIPPASAADSPAAVDPGEGSLLRRIRNSYPYQRSVQLVKWLFLPNFIFGPLMLLFIAWLIAGAATQLFAPFYEPGKAGCLVRDQAQRTPVDPLLRRQVDFRTIDPCVGTGRRVAAQRTYRIAFDVVEPWKDGYYATDPRGLRARDMRLGIGFVAAPFRRAVTAAYLQPVAAVVTSRSRDSAQFEPLVLTQSTLDPNRFEGEFTPPADGELYLFANDAVSLLDFDFFYADGGPRSINSGTACVTIEAADEPPAPIEEGGAICGQSRAVQQADKAEAAAAREAAAAPAL